MEYKETLMCWHSVRAGQEVLRNTLASLGKRKDVDIEQVILLAREKLDKYALGNDGIPMEQIMLDVKDPTDHKALYNAVKEHILPRVREIKKLHINVSPGTPAMHAVWLILHAGGNFHEGTRLWSSQLNQKTKRNNIKQVVFNINSYLSEIKKMESGERKHATYDADCLSDVRRTALQDLHKYSRLEGIPILILGERGTGKTRLVETIVKANKAGSKAEKIVVTMACGGLDSELADSLLFGHKKGAFTGADMERKGLLKEAHNNIVFLDEIQDLPKSSQRKLVRVLQDDRHRFRPLGSDEEEESNFELVCASNRSYKELSNLLDRDFFDRVSGLCLRLPPLRECREDLPNDWQNVWDECRYKHLPAIAPMSKNLKRILEQEYFPGNLRDLQKLAYMLIANWDPSNADHSIRTAIDYWKDRLLESSSLVKAQDMEKDRTSLLNAYKKELALKAKNRYGTWKEAAIALKCDEKTLRNDAVLPD